MGLTYYENGMRYITSSSKPIHVPDDLKDLRIRTMESRIHMVTFRTLGATPVPLAYNDLLTNLKSGNIDTQENPITNIYTGEIYKYQKYLTYTEHFYQPAPMFISYAIWSKLTQEQRAIILEAAEESSVYQRKLCDEMVEPATAEFKKYMELIEPDKSIWKKATEPVRAEFLVEVGPDYLEELETEIARLQAAGATE
jgi:TRAP-type C4-dicarboxylate transport system substrate-binding protein